MTAIDTGVRLVFGTALALLPGIVVSRALGLRSVAATISWSLAVLFACLAVTFALASPEPSQAAVSR